MVGATARRWWSVGIGLAVSGAALAGLAAVEGRAAQANVLGVVRAVEIERDAEEGPASDPLADLAEPDWSGVQGKIRQRSGASTAKTAVPVAAARAVAKSKPVPGGEAGSVQAVAVGDAPAAAVLVPDFVGKRLGAVRREARKLGIKVVARDEYGDRVPADLAHLYKVRKQNLAAGGALQPGATLELRARMPASYAMGY